jgi:hypothetical protein
MPSTILDRLTSPATMMDAEQELLTLGADAMPILASVLTGEAKNEFGVAYRALGLPLRCILEVARRLGVVARPLEPLLRVELHDGNFVAAMALGVLGSVDGSTIEELAAHLDYATNCEKGFLPAEYDLAFEAAVALIRLGQEAHPAVTTALTLSDRAAAYFERVKAFLKKEGHGL